MAGIVASWHTMVLPGWDRDKHKRTRCQVMMERGGNSLEAVVLAIGVAVLHLGSSQRGLSLLDSPATMPCKLRKMSMPTLGHIEVEGNNV